MGRKLLFLIMVVLGEFLYCILRRRDHPAPNRWARWSMMRCCRARMSGSWRTGTGIAATSLMRDEALENSARVIMMHTCRTVASWNGAATGRNPEGRSADRRDGRGQAALLPHHHPRRFSPSRPDPPDNLTSGKVFADLAIEPMDPSRDRAMVCGGYAFNKDVMAVAEGTACARRQFRAAREFVVKNCGRRRDRIRQDQPRKTRRRKPRVSATARARARRHAPAQSTCPAPT